MEHKTQVELTEKEMDLLLELVYAKGRSYGRVDHWRVNYQRMFVDNLYKKLQVARKSR